MPDHFLDIPYLESRMPKNPRSAEEYGSTQCDVVLHGACLILSTRFRENRMECFNPRTFLYGEEHILHHECMKQNLKWSIHLRYMLNTTCVYQQMLLLYLIMRNMLIDII